MVIYSMAFYEFDESQAPKMKLALLFTRKRKLALLEVINHDQIKLSPINYTFFEEKYFLQNVLPFSDICLQVKCGQIYKIFSFNHKNIYKSFIKTCYKKHIVPIFPV